MLHAARWHVESLCASSDCCFWEAREARVEMVVMGRLQAILMPRGSLCSLPPCRSGYSRLVMLSSTAGYNTESVLCTASQDRHVQHSDPLCVTCTLIKEDPTDPDNIEGTKLGVDACPDLL